MRKLLVVLAFCCSASLLAAQSQIPDTAVKKVKGNKVGSFSARITKPRSPP
jgi:hypothetical protein